MQAQPLGIIGLGLIGGSLARALKLKAGAEVIGMDRDAGVVKQAIDDGILTKGAVLPADFKGDAFSIFKNCQAVFIALPVRLIPAAADAVAGYCEGIITDVGSVKGTIMRDTKATRFVGGHPMAGSERQGYACASHTLFENAVYVLCTREGAQQDAQVLADWVSRIGATPVIMDAQRHDAAVAAISHLPHVTAAALVRAALAQADPSVARLAAGGFRDITRIASSDAALWAGISMQSRPRLSGLIRRQIEQLEGFLTALEGEDEAALIDYFNQAADLRNALPQRGSGALNAGAVLLVEVDDKPGVLGRIATLLGENGINIRNMRIDDARQYEGGRLRVIIDDADKLEQAASLLRKAGMDCG